MRLFSKKLRAFAKISSKQSKQLPACAFEALEGRQMLSAGYVTGLRLVDANADRDIMSVNNGTSINLSAEPSRNLNIRAVAGGSPASVKFSLDGGVTTDNTDPFALAGDNNGDFLAWTPSLGTHSLTATPYSGSNGTGTPGSSFTVTFTVVDQAALPLSPANLTATANPGGVTLSWSDNSGNEGGFLVSRSTDGKNYGDYATLSANTTSFTDSNVTAGRTYYYLVSAFNSMGKSYTSNTAIATAISSSTSETTAPPTAPASLPVLTGTPTSTPTNLTATAVSSSAVKLTWSDNAAGESGYKLFRSTDGVKYSAFLTVAANSTSYTDRNLPAGTYSYKVLAYSGSAESDVSNAASATLGSGSTTTTGGGSTTGTSSSPIAAPTNLTATATSSTDIRLTWSDNAAGESGYKLFRSTDGVKYSAFLTVAANSTSYTDRNLAAGAYSYKVLAYSGSAESSLSNVASATVGNTSTNPTTPVTPDPTPITNPTTTLPLLPQSTVNAAIAYPLIRYNKDIAGGAYTNQPGTGGAPEILAYAAYTGNTTADARLLQQIRYTITGGNEPAANGGYPAQHERHVTVMFNFVKNTPRIWNQLSSAEQNKVNLIMEATLVASAFTTNDANPYITSGSQQVTLDGDTNVGRDWNANYREGMLGGVLAGIAYFGVSGAQSLLNNFNWSTFVSQVQSAGLSNIYQTFTWKQNNTASVAPGGSVIQSGIRNWKYYGIGLDNPLGLYSKMSSFTYSANVNPGLNNGAGYGSTSAGRILSGASTLPNKGALGMLEEFDASDANGPRSSATYAYDDMRIDMNNVLAMIAGGIWQSGSTVAATAGRLMAIGNNDFWYKADHGYSNYAKGADRGTLYATQTDKGFEFTRPLWDTVMKPILGV